MKHLLITNIPAMTSRWKEAFPEGSLISIEELGEHTQTIVWLDLSTLSAAEKQQQLDCVAGAGHTLVALTTSPQKLEAMSVVRTGAKGYGHLLAIPSQFHQMATVVSNGGYWLGEELLTDVIEQTAIPILRNSDNEASSVTVDDGRNLLTGRECDVANEVARGASNKEIAEKLLVSERTVKAHLSMIFDKLAVRDRVQLALKMNCVSI